MVDVLTILLTDFRRWWLNFSRGHRCGRNTICRFSAACTAFGICSLIAIALVSTVEARDGNKDGYDNSKWMEQQQRQAEQMQRDAARQARQQQREQEQRQREAQERNQQESQKSDDKSNNQIQAQPATKSSDSSQTKAKDDADHDDDQDGSARKSGSNNRRANQDGGDTDAPPATIEKWLKQLVGGKPSAPVTNAPSAPVAKPVAPPTVVTTKAPAKPVVPAKAPTGGNPGPIHIPNAPALPEVLAINATPATVGRAKALGFKTTSVTTLANLNFAVTRLVPPSGMSTADAQALLQRELPNGSFAPNQKYRIYRAASGTDAAASNSNASVAGSSPASCGADRCFARDVIGWKSGLRGCGSGIKIGIIDTSVDVSHPAFVHRQLEVKHLGPSGPAGPNWHGTGVAALLAGDASSGTPGLVPDANFYVADIFHADADHEPSSDTVSMLRAFDWLEAKGVRIINMSLSGPPDELIRQAIDRLSGKGVLFVAAAGNEGPAAAPSYPAAYEQVIAVTAVNKNLQSYRYANRGSYIDVAAPGVAIWTALPGAKEGYHSGTSFATPYVTATLAALYPRLAVKTQTEALRQIQFKDLGEPGPDPVYGQGLLVAPSACASSQVAKAHTSPAAALPTASISPPSARVEQLPWLSFQGSDN